MGKNKYIVPLAFIGMMFFTVGFAVGINGYFVPFLENNLHLSSAQSYLVIAATFLAFLIFSFPAAAIIAKIGYKRTMSVSFFLFAAAFALFIPAAHLESFALYLLACFLSGTANTVLQAAINPYVTILGPIDSAARRISIMGICNSIALALPSVFIAAVTRKPIEQVGLTDLNTPLLIIVGVMVVFGLATIFAPLEEIKAQGEEKKKLEFTNHLASAKEYLLEEDAQINLQKIQETGYFSDLQIYMKEDNKAYKMNETDTL